MAGDKDFFSFFKLERAKVLLLLKKFRSELTTEIYIYVSCQVHVLMRAL